jgi:Fe-S oxidoreductase
MFGHIDLVARWGSRLAPWSNRAAQSRAGRWVNEKLLGIDRRRTPPAWVRRTFAMRCAAHADEATRPPLLLFNDTFTNHHHPEIGEAARRVLTAAGLSICLAPNRCCGRPLISQGRLDDARRRAAANTDALYPLVAAGSRVVFLEPSCLSAVREDAPALLRGDLQRRATEVAKASVSFEELIEAEHAAGRRTLPLRAGPKTILLHGHCHQKAMGLVAPARALLSRVPGASVVDLDAGCCGMAGSFGYTRDHYDVSRAIGERRLLPAARGLAADAVLVASGVSCRQQVRDFAGQRAWHPAELLAALTEGA